MSKKESLISQLEAVFDVYPDGTPEHAAADALAEIFFQLIKGSPENFPALEHAIQEHLGSHASNPAFHADLVKIAGLFSELVAEIAKEVQAKAQAIHTKRESANA